VIQNAIGSFGLVILWEKDLDYRARLLLHARVTDLADAPHFILLTESNGFQGESWTVQCDILEQEILSVLPADEDPIPVLNDDGHPPPFDFFGLGQSGLPAFNPPLNGNGGQNNINLPAAHNNMQHQQHAENPDEMVPIDDDEGLDLELVPFIGPLPPDPED
jgi:hypothetical protein